MEVDIRPGDSLQARMHSLKSIALGLSAPVLYPSFKISLMFSMRDAALNLDNPALFL